MKRREFLKSIVALIGLATVGCMPTKKENGRDYYHILLISDLHLPVRSKEFPDQAVQDEIWQKKQNLINNVNAWGDVDEAALLGDLAARYGNETEYRVVDGYVGSLNFPYYAVAGNHDYMYRDEPKKSGKKKKLSLEEKKAKLEAFTKRYKLPALYYARTVENCRLLYIAPDAFGSDVELSQEQLDWLKKEIAEHKNGPMLFFCHAPLYGTLRPYNDEINTVNRTAQPAQALSEILAEVPPGSLWISGHTHTPPTNDSFADDSVNRVHKNLVNIHNPTIDSRNTYTNSLYIYKDHITIRTFDHNAEKWLTDLERTYTF
ncbi:hypothetical protein D081_2148 [Anaerovibrio sp. JC8]|uniref:metallophosphoesterase family protein n=1 Tax=Anaerovibrio sp. JC8 TaxID=1240085 RepID=UPI000A0C2E6D|nr:metallophosphoesterase [Anaerovibrio sp. JC8]ORT99178.1 hypothetical protein D081_2148 [Anaerovibrio sp. JC8]